MPDAELHPTTWRIAVDQRDEAEAVLWICEAISRVVTFDSAAVVVAPNIDDRFQVAGSDPVLGRFGDLQQTVQEGPGVDAITGQQPVAIDDLVLRSAAGPDWRGQASTGSPSAA